MKIKLFNWSNIETLEDQVNEYLSSIRDEDIVSIKMSESDNYNTIMVVTKS